MKQLRSLVFLLLFMIFAWSGFSQPFVVWTANIDSTATFSSPRLADITGDGVLDIVLGGGEELAPTNYGVMAFDGANGNLLWKTQARDQIFTTAIFYDLNGDGVSDPIIGGRGASLLALNGVNGVRIWEFFPQGDTIFPGDSSLWNFYSCQFLPDLNGDGIPEILACNGGNVHAPPGDPNRPPGHVMVISGADGSQIAKAQVPDGRETYSSPVVADFFGDGVLRVVFGTGGETIQGSLWRVTLQEILDENLSGAEQLHTSTTNGYVAPASLADLNGDGVLDIIANSYDDDIVAIDGATKAILWQVSIPDGETPVAPAIGYFNADSIPDVHTTIGNGVWPIYSEFYRLALDGSNGNIISSDTLFFYHLSAALAVDLDGDGRDEAISITSYPQYNAVLDTTVFYTQIEARNFATGQVAILDGPVPGTNPIATGWVGDMDNDGVLDYVYSFQADSLNPFTTSNLRLRRLNLGVPVPEKISWGGYMGTRGDGIFGQHEIVSVKEVSSLVTFVLFPNPAENSLNIRLSHPEAITRAVVYSLDGKPVLTWSLNKLDSEFSVSLEGLVSGMYILRLDGINRPGVVRTNLFKK